MRCLSLLWDGNDQTSYTVKTENCNSILSEIITLLVYKVIRYKRCSLCMILVSKADELSCFCKLATSGNIPFIIMIMYLK